MDTTSPPIPPADEVLALPHFEERLLTVLRDRHAAGTWSQPLTPDAGATLLADDELLGIDGQARRNGAGSHASATGEPVGTGGIAASGGEVDPSPPADQPRPGASRRWSARPGGRRRLLAAAAAVLVVGGVIVAVRAGDGDPPDVGTAETPPTSAPGDSEGAAQMSPEEQRIHDAIVEAAPSSVIHTTGPRASDSEWWYDVTTQTQRGITRRADGRPLIDMGPGVPPNLDGSPAPSAPGDYGPVVPRRFVDHCLRKYADTQDPNLYLGPETDALVQSLVEGSANVDGTEVVDGRELIRVVMTFELPPDLTVPGEVTVTTPEFVYVDPATSLPVSWAGPDGSRTEVEFLPRTAENLAFLVPPVPDGFTQVETPPLDDERAAANCFF